MIVFCDYNLQFDEKTAFPKVLECIRIVIRRNSLETNNERLF